MINVQIKGDVIQAHNSKGQLIEVFINQCPIKESMYWVVKIDHVLHTDIDEYKYIGTIWEDKNTLEGIFICFN